MAIATMHGESAKNQDEVPAPGVIEELTGVFASVRATLSNLLDLLSLEARRAGLALMWMLVCGVIAAACIVSAWLGLMAALVICAVAMGASLLVAVIAVTLVNAAAGGLLIYRAISMSQALRFSATRRQLAGKPHPVPVTS